MCIQTQTFTGPDGLAREAPCRNCWQCRENRVNDLVGRCIAESHTAAETVAVTLTYSGDHVNAAVLVYADFQNFVKRLRSAGYRVRYIVAGEYGSKKGRAHWHAVLFFEDEAPELPPFDQRASWSYWTDHDAGRGFVFLQRPDYEGFRYVLKYVLKGQTGPRGSTHLAMSKKPPLGYRFFMELADSYVEQRLSPQSGLYQFRGVKNAKGQHRRFHLQGRMRELFSEMFMIRYRAHHGREYPFSEWLEAQEDEWHRREPFQMSDAEWFAFKEENRVRGLELPEPFGEREADRPVPVGCLVYPLDGHMLLERYSDGSFALYHGEDNERWHLESEDQLDAALRLLGVPHHRRGGRPSSGQPAAGMP